MKKAAKTPANTIVGIDSGGTFTDAVAVRADGSVRVAKVASTPDDPARATSEAFAAVAGDVDRDAAELRHGTTVPTNALLEQRGARTALVTTAGFADVIEIGRQRRPDLYDISVNRPPALVPPELRFEVSERISHDGNVVTDLECGDIAEMVKAAGAEAVGVSLLHSYANPVHEQDVAAAVDAGGERFVVASHDVANEYREFERTSTAVLNAYLGPGTASYFARLAGSADLPDDILIMRSSGGLGSVSDLCRHPADALVSGPAAGALAAGAVAAAAGFPDAVGFDMGGTSTDVVLVRDGKPELRALTEISGYPCLAPALAVHTVGAGGGSIARIDAGGALRVGPRSAGAVPGPVAYGRGGSEPTVTDANVELDRVRSLVGGAMALHSAAASAALAGLGADAASGVIEVVEANMERAMREVTVQRGVDPAGLAIIAFGGAGGLHAARLCEALGARAVVVPPHAGLLSAVGLVCAPVRADSSQTVLVRLDDFDITRFDSLVDEAAASIRWAGEPVIERIADCRYRGQSHEIQVPAEPGDAVEVIARRFHDEHERLNGYARPGAEVQVVTIRAAAEVASPVAVADVLAASRVRPDGDDLMRGGLRVGELRPGPDVIVEDEQTVFVPDGFNVRRDDLDNLVLEPA